MERLVLEMRQSLEAMPSANEEPFIEYMQGGVRHDTVFSLMRVFNNERWESMLKLLLAFDSGYGLNFKVCQRFLVREGNLGFLWEITIQGANLQEAVYAFRSILMACVHELWLSPQSSSTLPMQERVRIVTAQLKASQPETEPPTEASVDDVDADAAAALRDYHGDEAINEPVVVRRPARTRKALGVPNLPRTDEMKSGVIPEGSQTADGKGYTVKLPQAQPEKWNEKVGPVGGSRRGTRR